MCEQVVFLWFLLSVSSDIIIIPVNLYTNLSLVCHGFFCNRKKRPPVLLIGGKIETQEVEHKFTFLFHAKQCKYYVLQCFRKLNLFYRNWHSIL